MGTMMTAVEVVMAIPKLVEVEIASKGLAAWARHPENRSHPFREYVILTSGTMTQ